MTDSILRTLLKDLPHLKSQMYFKSSLAALSRAMEDLVLADVDSPLIIVNFRQEQLSHQQVRRFQQVAQQTKHFYALTPSSSKFEIEAPRATPIIPLDPNDELSQEWYLVIIAKEYSACLVCKEFTDKSFPVEQMRRFEGFWTFDRHTSIHASRLLLGRIVTYCPELKTKVDEAWQHYGLTVEPSAQGLIPTAQEDQANIFGQRLVTYLQAGQYKLMKAYQAIAAQEQQKRLINTITTTIRNSLDPKAVLHTTVQELGQAFQNCRCLLYCCHPNDSQVKIEYEFVTSTLPSLKRKIWMLADNSLIQVAFSQERAIAIADVEKAPHLQRDPVLKAQIQHGKIRSWLLVPIYYQATLYGMIELHSGGAAPYAWTKDDIALVETIATQVGVALTHAQAYCELAEFNQQLESLERTQRNLIAIVGHELRTPLSTIQICLESIATEPNMPAEFLNEMLDAALTDSARMRKLVLDFLTLSRLESSKPIASPELIQLNEAIDMALCSFKNTLSPKINPNITVDLATDLPLIQADAEGLVEVLTKLLDNACKFTNPDGEILVQAHMADPEVIKSLSSQTGKRSKNNSDVPVIEVILTDSGCGIEPNQLDIIFRRFFQEENFLQRSVGGMGLGLAICRQIIENMGGAIWAESAGKNQGSAFHVILPIAQSSISQNLSLCL